MGGGGGGGGRKESETNREEVLKHRMDKTSSTGEVDK